MYYLSYGSNLCWAQMRKRCPRAEPVCPVSVASMRLIFRNYADIEPYEGRRVVGGLWRITTSCEEILDDYEEINQGLYRKEFISLRVILRGQEKEISALTYKMNATFYAPPSQEYLAIIREGYHDFGLDQNFLIQAFEESI